ncbi:hypothetical protein RRG08_001049 [Elysia crispata]|uniref:Uncharacterized protein n=1 Tax=Elysia crispata TaxID=231223 RepID=A0AAE1AX09_9GAST|nr:hypothetical protein RRG08_001049 [Elysia crispata]
MGKRTTRGDQDGMGSVAGTTAFDTQECQFVFCDVDLDSTRNKFRLIKWINHQARKTDREPHHIDAPDRLQR